MSHTTYPYDQIDTSRYTFTSTGKRDITKVVDFTPTNIKGMVSLGFGDLLPNGTVSDFVISNNGDIRVVLSTLVEIIKDYTTRSRNAKIVFTGSTSERTKLYTRILRTYYEAFRNEFIIKAFLKNIYYEEVDFNPADTREYYAFYVKRIN